MLNSRDGIDLSLRDHICFKPFVDERNIRLSNELKTTVNSVSLHVRRGDYMLPENICWFINLSTTSYYERAIQYMQEKLDNPVFFVFSNDIVWCKAHLPVPEGSRYIDWNQGDACIFDMELMSMCQHNIIANSSFSGWAAWINPHPDKIVITPKYWFCEPRDFADGSRSVTFSKDWIQL